MKVPSDQRQRQLRQSDAMVRSKICMTKIVEKISCRCDYVHATRRATTSVASVSTVSMGVLRRANLNNRIRSGFGGFGCQTGREAIVHGHIDLKLCWCRAVYRPSAKGWEAEELRKQSTHEKGRHLD